MNGLCQFGPAADFGLFYPESATIKHRPIRADVPGILHFFFVFVGLQENHLARTSAGEIGELN